MGRLNDRSDGTHIANSGAHSEQETLAAAIVTVVIKLIKGLHLAHSQAHFSHLLCTWHRTLQFYDQQKQVWEAGTSGAQKLLGFDRICLSKLSKEKRVKVKKHYYYQGSANYSLWAKSCPLLATCFISTFLLEHSTSIHFQPVAGYLYAATAELNCVVAIEALWPIKMKAFATWTVTEKVCWPQYSSEGYQGERSTRNQGTAINYNTKHWSDSSENQNSCKQH